jgi:hypothetical protein
VVVSGSRVANLLRDRNADHDQDQQHQQLLHAEPFLQTYMQTSSASTMVSDSVPYDLVSVMSPLAATRQVRFEEQLRPTRRSWLWLPPILIITFLAISPLIVPFALIAWGINVGRFWTITVRIDDDYLWVGRRWVRLTALDLTTLGRAQNTWPWRTFSPRWLGGNPIWKRDSVGVRGFDEGKPIWVSVGTDRRDELVAALEAAKAAAPARAEQWAAHAQAISPPSWHPDPWDPSGGALRWWDGTQWTGWTWPPAGGTPGVTS